MLAKSIEKILDESQGDSVCTITFLTAFQVYGCEWVITTRRDELMIAEATSWPLPFLCLSRADCEAAALPFMPRTIAELIPQLTIGDWTAPHLTALNDYPE